MRLDYGRKSAIADKLQRRNFDANVPMDRRLFSAGSFVTRVLDSRASALRLVVSWSYYEMRQGVSGLLRETRLDRSNQKKNSSEQHELRCQAPDAVDLETLKKIVFFGQGHGVGKASLEEGVFEAPNIFYECSKNDFHACFR